MPPKKSSLVNHWIRTIAFLLSSAAALPGFAQTFSIIHRFTGNAGAGNPAFQLVQDAAGNLYGTTSWGGAVRSCEGSGCGGVYRLSPNGNGGWTYTELYNFQFGAEPYNLILDSAGNLYGTSAAGGPSGAGLVFELSPTTTGPWTFTTLYAFTGGSDGSLPNGYLVFDAEGNLYGTTAYGGNSENLGTVFELSPQAGGGWTEQVLWDFNFTSNAGYNPSAGVVFDAQGNLYGTTSGDQAIGTYGTVYKLTKGASGWEATLLHEFKGSGDGGIPEAPVAIDAAGNLYGTTIIGGAQGSSGTGTVYELSPNGSGGYSFGVLHDFGKTGQSYYPVVLDSSGNLIGVADGGRTNPPGFVFKLTHSGTSWSYSVLHGFDGNNGFQPNTVMIDPSGNIYGVTNAGGIAGCANDSGCGTIFEIAAAAN